MAYTAANHLQRIESAGGDDDKVAINEIFEVVPVLNMSKIVSIPDAICLTLFSAIVYIGCL